MGRDITQCHPQLRELAEKLIAQCEKQGLAVKLGECFRTVEEQDRLYAQGRTAKGSIVTNAKGSSFQSMHQWGVAFDVIRADGKGAYNDSDGWFGRVGRIGKSLGLEWGGDWTNPVDKPHFQLPQWGSGPAKLKKLYGTVDNFKKIWQPYKPDIKEDEEMVSEGKAFVNGREYKIDRILKDGANYIKADNFGNMGFRVGFEPNTKSVTIDNKIDRLSVEAEGAEGAVSAVNIKGYNFVSLREITVLLGMEAEAAEGGIVIRKRE